MKKVLSFVLVLAMILGSVSMVFAGSFPDVEDKDCEGAVNVLSELDIISGYTDGTFKPEKVVTRAEMAALLINALGITPAKTSGTKFSDVPYTHWAAPFVDYAQSLGIISGYTDGTFKPDQTVTYNEAITMVVKALGYRDECLVGTYPASYVNQAMTLGLLDDVQAGTAGAVRGDIAQLLYAAMGADMVFVSANGYITFTGKTMFDRHGVTKLTNYVIDDEDIADAYTDISDKLGARATVWVDEDGCIVAVEEVKSDNYVGEYDADDKTVAGYSVKTTAFDKTYTLFKNGDVVTTTSAAFTWQKYVEYTIEGTVSGKYFTRIDSIAYWEEKATFQLTEDMLEDFEDDVVKLNGYSFNANNDDEIKEGSYILAGVDTLEDLEEDQVVTVYLNQAGKIAKLEVGTTVVTGTPSKINSDKDTVTVEGTAYDMYTGTFSGNVETEYDFFLTYGGEIFAWDGVSVNTNYAVVTDFGVNGASMRNGASVYSVTLFTAEGKEVTYEVKKTVAEAYATAVGGNWANVTTDAKIRGTVAKYALNDDGVVSTLTYVSVSPLTDVTVSKKGSISGKYLADDALVVVTDDWAKTLTPATFDADKYDLALSSTEKILGEKLATYAYIYDTSTNKITVVLADLGGTSEGIYGVYAGYATVAVSGETKYEVYFYDQAGEKVTYVTDALANVTVTSGAVAKITLTDGKLSATALVGANDNATTSATCTIVNNTFNDGTQDYGLDKDVVVLRFKTADSSVKVGKVANLTSADYAGTAYFYDVDTAAWTGNSADTGDALYDFVVIVY